MLDLNVIGLVLKRLCPLHHNIKPSECVSENVAKLLKTQEELEKQRKQ